VQGFETIDVDEIKPTKSPIKSPKKAPNKIENDNLVLIEQVILPEK
jgi:hypothetical protein